MAPGNDSVMVQMRIALERALAPSVLEIEDDGARHAGHAAAGRGHFRVTLVSEAFRGRPALERHRMVYAALGSLLRTSVHALNISARTADENDTPST